MRRLLAMRQAGNFERWLNRLGVVEIKRPASNSLTGRLAVSGLGSMGGLVVVAQPGDPVV